MTTPPPQPQEPEDHPYDTLSSVAGRLVHLILKLLSWGNIAAERLANPPHGPGNYDILDEIHYFRVERALCWARALLDVFSGKLRLTPPSPRAAAKTRKPRAAPAECRGENPNPLGASRATIREIFTTRSIREIVVRICRDLDLKAGTALWPAEMMRMDQTPAEWSAANYPPTDPPAPRLTVRWQLVAPQPNPPSAPPLHAPPLHAPPLAAPPHPMWRPDHPPNP